MTSCTDSGRARSAFALVLICAAVLVAGVRPAHAGINVWTSHGPGREAVNAVVIDPTTSTTLYVGTAGGGVFKSTDSGGTWNTLNTGLTNAFVNALAIDPVEPRRVYAATDRGVFAIEEVQVVGTGTPASCTEAAFDVALASGGFIPFDCGRDPVTITVTSTKDVAIDTAISGDGRITISGGK
jgi:hypothetical protein